MNQAESRARPDVGDVKMPIPSACGAAKQGLPGRPRSSAHSFWHWSPSFISSVWQIVTPMSLGHEAGRYSLTWKKSLSSVVTSAPVSSLFQVISPISQAGKSEVLLVQKRQKNGANEGSSGS